MLVRVASLVLLLTWFVSPISARDTTHDFRSMPLPAGWTETVVEHPKQTVDDIAGRLDVSLSRITMRKLSIHGMRVDVNLITAPDEANAKKVAARIIQMRGADFVRAHGTEMVEVAATNSGLIASRVLAWLGLEGGTTAVYDFEASLGLMDAATHDYMEANPVLQRFLSIDNGVKPDEAEAFIREAVKDWTSGDALSLFTGPRLHEHATYTFTPAPASHGASGMVTRWAFKEHKSRLGIRYVDVKGAVHVRARFTPEPVEGDPGTIEATTWWPVDAPWIQDAARKLTRDAKTPRERVLGILEYVHRGMQYGGQVGSRYGVIRAMKQGYGHCWDKSDVFITLCRAAGIPARQWAGWVPTMKSGHVWAEVHLTGEGWIPVDPTTPWLGTSHHYVPVFMSDTGDMPIQYVRWPRVRRR